MKTQEGSILLEGLIAIVIFSMGILALVGMQANAIGQTSDSKYRSDASFLANRIIGQIWVNRTAIASYECDPCSSTNGNNDTKQWVADMTTGANALPGAAASIDVVGTTQVIVTVRWQPPRATAHNHIATAFISNPS